MKKGLILFIIILTTPLLIFSQANKLYKKALKTEKLEDKIQLLTQVVNLKPNKFDAYFHRGVAFEDIGNYKEAINDYSKIIANKPDAIAYFNRGNAKYELQDFKGAKFDYEKALKYDSLFADALHNLAWTHYDMEDYKQAIELSNRLSDKKYNTIIHSEYDIGIITTQYSSKTYYLKALSYEKLGDYENAFKNYKSMSFLDHTSESLYNLGRFYTKINSFKKAKSRLLFSLRRNKNNSFAHFYLGVSNFRLGDFAKAISNFSTALEFDSSDFDAMLGLSMAYYKLEDLPKTRLYFDKATRLLEITEEFDNSINFFKNTYWYQNQLHVFSDVFTKLDNL